MTEIDQPLCSQPGARREGEGGILKRFEGYRLELLAVFVVLQGTGPFRVVDRALRVEESIRAPNFDAPRVMLFEPFVFRCQQIRVTLLPEPFVEGASEPSWRHSVATDFVR